MSTVKLSFKPKQVTKKLLQPLKDRARDVIMRRYGLDTGVSQTLQMIGDSYGITRERVRQIENFAIKAIRSAPSFAEAQTVFAELKTAINDLGGVVHQDHLLKKLTKDTVDQNHIGLYLVIGDEFTQLKEDDKFKTRWTIDPELAEKVHSVLDTIHDTLSAEDLAEEDKLVEAFLESAKKNKVPAEHIRDDVARRLLWMSKLMGRNALGNWGKSSSPNVKTRGVRDYAYLVMRHHGSPMHFREVAKAITDTFHKPTHVATCHNELIKDSRFVLIGRGVYALKDWGYRAGTAREVIAEIIKAEGRAMSRDEVIERVMKERYLKKNTILVNLQNPKFFKKDANGMYSAL